MKHTLFKTFPGLPEDTLEARLEDNEYRLRQTIEEIQLEQGSNYATTVGPKPYRNAAAVPHTQTPLTTVTPRRSEHPVPPNYHHLREEMTALEAKRKQLHEKTKNCFQAKQFFVASYYTDEKRKVDQRLDALSRKLVDSQQHTLNNTNTLDLHGYRVEWVIRLLDSFLERKQHDLNNSNDRKLVVDIITGYGKNGSAPKIKPQVLNHLKLKKLKFRETANKGLIQVTLTN
jgi:DNA-nicking Smr family endonuclease